MKKNNKYLAATAIGVCAVIALFTMASRFDMTASIQDVPARTSPADLAQLANFTRINVDGDFDLEVSQLQDYSIEFQPLSETQGELVARVEDDTLIVTGYANRSETAAAVVRIGVPVLDTLEVSSLPEITVSNFNAPLMNIQLKAFRSFTLENSVITTLNLSSEGRGEINLRGNTLTTQNLRLDEESELNVID